MRRGHGAQRGARHLHVERLGLGNVVSHIYKIICMYIYIYRERERDTCICMYVCIYVYILYMYIHAHVCIYIYIYTHNHIHKEFVFVLRSVCADSSSLQISPILSSLVVLQGKMTVSANLRDSWPCTSYYGIV